MYSSNFKDDSIIYIKSAESNPQHQRRDHDQDRGAGARAAEGHVPRRALHAIGLRVPRLVLARARERAHAPLANW